MTKRCLHPECRTERDLVRGLCVVHYGQAKRAVVAGVTTWKKLEAKKKAAPPRGPSWFRQP